jgi:hypothetical protein
LSTKLLVNAVRPPTSAIIAAAVGAVDPAAQLAIEKPKLAIWLRQALEQMVESQCQSPEAALSVA